MPEKLNASSKARHIEVVRRLEVAEKSVRPTSELVAVVEVNSSRRSIVEVLHREGGRSSRGAGRMLASIYRADGLSVKLFLEYMSTSAAHLDGRALRHYHDSHLIASDTSRRFRELFRERHMSRRKCCASSRC